MFQREAMNESSMLAKNIISNLKETKLAVNRGHRFAGFAVLKSCLLYTSPSPRDVEESRMPSSA